MKRKLASVILLIALVAIALVAAIPAAADEPVNVDPVVGGPYLVSADDNIHLYYWYWVTTRGHVITYLKGNETSYTLQNANNEIVWSLTAEEAAPYWSEPFQIDWSEWIDYPMPYLWAAAWEYPLGSLEFLDPGIYTLTTTIYLKHPMIDGHVIRDKETGKRIFPTPMFLPAGTQEYYVTIIVE